MGVAELLASGARCDRSGALWRDFLEFHKENPWVYERLRQMCLDLRWRGFNHYSTRTLIAVLRFEWDMKTGGSDVSIDGGNRRVKLNDHHSPYYARLLIENEPSFAHFFELRHAEGDPEPSGTI